MKLSASKAAQAVGKSVQTITKSIQDGRLSAERLDSGAYSIDPSELFRVFPPATTGGSIGGSMEGDRTPPDMAVLQAEIGKRDFMIERLKEEISKLEADRDEWRGQAKTLLLNPPSPRSRRPQGIKGFLQRVWGHSSQTDDGGK